MCNRVTIKIAVIEARATFTDWIGSHRIGFEIGSDIFSAPHLDEYFVYEKDESSLIEIYLEVIFNHLKSNLPFDYLGKRYSVSDWRMLADRLLTEKAIVELGRAAEGVMRDLLNIFILAVSKASKMVDEFTGKIEAIHIVEAAHQWFERDKLQSIPPETARALAVLERKLIAERGTRFFAVPSELPKTRVLLSLIDSRLVHSVWRNLADPNNPGNRYSIYCLDYGSCLSIVRGSERYRQNVKYYDLMEKISIKLDQMNDFSEIITEDLFGLEVPGEVEVAKS